MPNAEKIPHIDYLGRCYDVVEMDPLNLASSSKLRTAVDVDVGASPKITPDGRWLIPAGVLHGGAPVTAFESQSAVISSSYEFQQEFKQSVSVDAGVEGAFEFSGSASVHETERQTETRTSSFVYSRAYREVHRLELDLAHSKALLQVSSTLRDAVGKLPTDELGWIAPYREFIELFGTHFAKQIVLGGLAHQRTSGSSKTYLRSKQMENTLAAKAGIQIEMVKAGASAEDARAEAAKADGEAHLGRLVWKGEMGRLRHLRTT